MEWIYVKKYDFKDLQTKRQYLNQTFEIYGKEEIVKIYGLVFYFIRRYFECDICNVSVFSLNIPPCNEWPPSTKEIHERFYKILEIN